MRIRFWGPRSAQSTPTVSHRLLADGLLGRFGGRAVEMVAWDPPRWGGVVCRIFCTGRRQQRGRSARPERHRPTAHVVAGKLRRVRRLSRRRPLPPPLPRPPAGGPAPGGRAAGVPVLRGARRRGFLARGPSRPGGEPAGVLPRRRLHGESPSPLFLSRLPSEQKAERGHTSRQPPTVAGR